MGGWRGLIVGAFWAVGLVVVALVIAAVVLDRGPHSESRPGASASPGPNAAAVRPITPLVASTQTPSPSDKSVIEAKDLPVPALPIMEITAAQGCVAPAFASAARANVMSLATLSWSPFRRPEIGWQTYAPSIGREIGAGCGPQTEGFALSLAKWQASRKLPATGVLDEATFSTMRNRWEQARPFVRLTAGGVCPPGPDPADLASATLTEGYAGKAVRLMPGALASYRRMVAAARADSPTIAADKRLLAIFSGYRSPEADAARCARDGDCGAITRASCSAHRTGTAVDLVLDSDPARQPDSATDPDRLRLSRSPAYAWMIARAGDFGFVNYPFEPWHWEWTGQP